MRFALAQFFAICGLVGALSLTTGCNTIAGAGKDVQKGGEAIHDEAKDVQRKM